MARRLWLWAAALAGAALHLLLAGEWAVASWRAHLEAPAATVLVQDRTGAFLGELIPAFAATRGGPASDPQVERSDGLAGLGYWRLGVLPERVVLATVALEDRRFFLHPGVDPVALLRAAWQNLQGGRRISGASTLAMQVARLQHPGARGYVRKLNEVLTALFLTERYGRDEILRHYLRIVPYGNRIHGISYAARRYLSKPAEDLSWAEIAFLAALPQSPTRMNPYTSDGGARALGRAGRLLRLLADQGALSPAQHDLARRELAALRLPWLERRPPEALHALLRLGKEIPAGVAAGGGILRSTLDLDLQKEGAWMTYEAVRAWEGRGAGNAALVVLDPKSGGVLAWIGSADYFDAERAGAIDYAQLPRSPGSALKPFLYAQALERGVITPATVLDDLRRGPGDIANADERFLGPLLPRVALANSRNVPAAELLGRLGIGQGYAFLRELGLHDGAQPASRYGLGLAIGGLPVTLEHVARAYTALASGGLLLPLRWWAGGAAGEPRRVVSEDTARQITLFLSDPLARLPSFPRMGATEFPFPVAMKTGTSTNYRDAWAIGYSTRYLVGAWVGNAEFRPMNRLSGYRSAAELVQRVLLRLHRDEADGLADLSFPPPRGFRAARVCALTGRRAVAACDRVFLEWFAPGSEPLEDCTAHRVRAVDRRTGRLATRQTPPAARELRTFVELPARYAEWLQHSSLAGAPRRAAMRASGGVGAPAAPRLRQDVAASVRLQITSPENGSVLLRDPETPASSATLALQAVVDPVAPQVVWYVDGRPFLVADPPYATRWPLASGAHTFQLRLPWGEAASRLVRVVVE